MKPCRISGGKSGIFKTMQHVSKPVQVFQLKPTQTALLWTKQSQVTGPLRPGYKDGRKDIVQDPELEHEISQLLAARQALAPKIWAQFRDSKDLSKFNLERTLSRYTGSAVFNDTRYTLDNKLFRRPEIHGQPTSNTMWDSIYHFAVFIFLGFIVFSWGPQFVREVKVGEDRGFRGRVRGAVPDTVTQDEVETPQVVPSPDGVVQNQQSSAAPAAERPEELVSKAMHEHSIVKLNAPKEQNTSTETPSTGWASWTRRFMPSLGRKQGLDDGQKLNSGQQELNTVIVNHHDAQKTATEAASARDSRFTQQLGPTETRTNVSRT